MIPQFFDDHALHDCLPFAGLLWREDLFDIETFLGLWQEKFGLLSKIEVPVDTMSDYYQKEMGVSSQYKRLLVLGGNKAKKIDLISWKLWSQQVESDFMDNEGHRTLNIDMGFIALDQVFLSTFKPFSHRVYMGQGVFIDPTYYYHLGEFRSFPWTYPDYQKDLFKSIFKNWRALLK